MKSMMSSRYAMGFAVALLGTAMTWSYWPVLTELAEAWGQNPLYSHGYFVPVFALVLLWIRREQMPALPVQPSYWSLAFLVVAVAMRLGAAHYYFSWPDRGSLLFMVFAGVLAIGGRRAARWAWPSVLFLAFMLPFPGFVETRVVQPLQRVATICSTNALQTLGFFAHADGNVIVLSEAEMGIVEACSGLRMLSTFVALTVGACFVLDRPTWQKVGIALSSIPIAIACNVVRITTTGILHETTTFEIADKGHEILGYGMPVLALAMLVVELKLLDFVFVITPPRPVSAPVSAAPAKSAPAVPRKVEVSATCP